MPNPDILTEIPPISGQDCFVVFDRYKREFCFPVHIHKEYELNLVYGARGRPASWAIPCAKYQTGIWS